MAPAVGPLRARVLRGDRHRVGIASRKVAVGPGRAGKEGWTLRIAFAGGEGIAEADHQTVSRRNRHARLRSVWRGPQDGLPTGDCLGVVGVGGDDDAERRQSPEMVVGPAWSARCVAATNCRGSAASAGTAPAKLHWLTAPRPISLSSN